MIIIPPSSQRGTPQKPQTQHDTTVGMFVVAVLMLGIGIVLVLSATRSRTPPPPALPYVIFGIAALFGAIAFFSWQKEQGDALGGGDDRKES
jgi:drug/metabolite transporter (DMT)-like permease